MNLTRLVTFLSFVALSYSQNLTTSPIVSNQTISTTTMPGANTKKFGKRLETVEGVEIASSYKEYMDLALSDLEDRLNKSRLKLKDFNDRIKKRTQLLSEISNEIERRKDLAKDFIEKDKQLRSRLLRNTEMKSAITNLADLAEYKLSNRRQNTNFESDINELLKKENNSVKLDKALNSKELNSTFIEMAYNEINNILAYDKQTLMQLIRKKLTNDYKLKELEKLKVNVDGSLKKLESSKQRLSQMIQHDADIDDILKQLKSRNRLEPEEKKKILSLIGFFPQNKE